MTYEIAEEYRNLKRNNTFLNGRLVNLGSEGAFSVKGKSTKQHPEGKTTEYAKPTQKDLKTLFEMGSKLVVKTKKTLKEDDNK